MISETIQTCLINKHTRLHSLWWVHQCNVYVKETLAVRIVLPTSYLTAVSRHLPIWTYSSAPPRLICHHSIKNSSLKEAFIRKKCTIFYIQERNSIEKETFFYPLKETGGIIKPNVKKVTLFFKEGFPYLFSFLFSLTENNLAMCHYWSLHISLCRRSM